MSIHTMDDLIYSILFAVIKVDVSGLISSKVLIYPYFHLSIIAHADHLIIDEKVAFHLFLELLVALQRPFDYISCLRSCETSLIF